MLKSNKNIVKIAFLLGITSTLFYSIGESTIKWILLNSKVNVIVFYFHAVTLMLLIITIIGLFFLGKKLFYLKSKPHIIVIRAGLTFINFFLSFVVLKTLPLDIYYSLVFTSPILASIIAIFVLKEKLNLTKSVALVFGIVGILIIANPFSEDMHASYITPMLLSIILALSLALTAIVTRRYMQNDNPLSVSFYVFLFSSLLSLVISSFIEHSDITSISYVNPIFLLIVAVCFVLGILLFITAYQSAQVQIIVITEYALIIWGIPIGYYLFNDTVKINTAIGIVLIIFSTMLVSNNLRKKVRNN